MQAAQARLEYLLSDEKRFGTTLQNVLKDYWWLSVLITLMIALLTLAQFRKLREGCTIMPFEYSGDDKSLNQLIPLIAEELQEIKQTFTLRGNNGFLSLDQRLALPIFSIFAEENTIIKSLSALENIEVKGIKIPSGKLVGFGWSFFKPTTYILRGKILKTTDGASVKLAIKNNPSSHTNEIKSWYVSAEANKTDDIPVFQRIVSLEEQLAKKIAAGVLFHIYGTKLKVKALPTLYSFLISLQQLAEHKNTTPNWVNLEKQIEDTVKAEPDWELGYYILGIIKMHGEKYKESRDAFKKVIETGNNFKEEATYNIALAYLNEFQKPVTRKNPRNLEMAIEKFGSLIFSLEKDQATTNKVNQALLALSYCGEAVAKAISLTNPTLQKDTNLFEKTCKDVEEVVKTHLTKGLALLPADSQIITWTNYAKGQLFRTLGKEKEAITYFCAAIENDKSYLPAYYELARIHYGLEKYIEAINLLETIKGYKHYETHFLLGENYYALYLRNSDNSQNLVSAKAAYSNAMEFYRHFEAANKLGDIYIRQWQVKKNENDLDNAIEAYTKAIEYNGDHPRGLRSLAYFKLAKLNTQLPLNPYSNELEQIYRNAEKAAAKKVPEEWHWQSLDVEGWVLYHQNNIPLAVKKLEESVENTHGRNHVSNYYHLAEAYIKRRSFVQAKEALEKAQENLKNLSQSPEFEAESFLKEKIKGLCNQLGM